MDFIHNSLQLRQAPQNLTWIGFERALTALEHEIDSNAEAVRDIILIGCKIVPGGDRKRFRYQESEVDTADQCIWIDSTASDSE